MATSVEVDLLSAAGEIMHSSSPGIAFEIDNEESPGSTFLVPKRIIKRLQRATENKTKSPASLEEIKAKLKEADLRRQQFHEWLVNKAKARPKSSTSSPLRKDLGGKLAARLFAAEQKRMDLLTQDQMRLAKLHELRVAAKTEAQLRAEREREELGSKVEYRVQQAELNRLALLEAEKQRRALAHERVAQSLTQRMTQEGKDRERIEALRATICQKIAAAEEKRACLLEAEKSRAKAIVLQARKVANSVVRERELELRKKKENLEARLSRAKRQRAEYLQQRGGCRGACHNHGHKMSKHGDRLCRKLTRCWRQFRRSRRTTHTLAQEYAACAMNQLSLSSLPFEQLAARITSSGTLRSVKALLGRIESRLLLSTSRQSGVGNVDHLLKRLSPVQRKTGAAGRASRRGNLQGSNNNKLGAVEVGRVSGKGKDGHTFEDREFERYPARVFLCAYMIMGHPDAVFSIRGDHEVALAEAAAKLLPEFETLVSIILDGPSCSSPSSRPLSPTSVHEKQLIDTYDQLSTPCQSSPMRTFSAQLVSFDSAWCSYLYHFVVWKVKDAQSLEEDLIRVACQLEASMLQKCGMIPNNDGSDLSHDSQAIQKQVLEDQKLLHDRVFHLTGQSGVGKMQEALSVVRVKYSEARKSGASLPSPFSFSSSSPISSPSSSSSSSDEQQIRRKPRSKVARSLFSSPSSKPQSSSGDFAGKGCNNTLNDLPVNASADFHNTGFTNEQIVNEMLHDPSWKFKGMNIQKMIQEQSISIKEEQSNSITNIQAFWDSVLDCLVKDPPDYERVVSLVREIRDDLASLIPEDWKQELWECLDLEILCQVLNSGIKDFEYLRRLLDYTLNMIVKLGAPVRDEDAKLAHQRLLENISRANSTDTSPEVSFNEALVEGLRFIFEQLQVLKQDINNIRLRALASLVTGSAGVEYLQKAFAKCYALPLKPSIPSPVYTAIMSQKLPRTAKWVSDVKCTLEQVKSEVEASLAAVRAANAKIESSPIAASPMPLSMCTGGRLAKVCSERVMQQSSLPDPDQEFVMAAWDSIYTIVRLGSLDIACSCEAATEETLPETLVLNVNRLRDAQNNFQRVVVMATGLLLVRQELAKVKVSGSNLESVLEMGVSQLDSLLSEPAVTIPQIGSLLARMCHFTGGESSSNLLLREELMTRVLGKSLNPDDHVFQLVSGAIKASMRGMLILGTGKEGTAVSESALKRVGSCSLIGHVSKLVASLQILATVTRKVHNEWYISLAGAV
ncbi:hypothetical protein O6H91_Y539400 [Diphasiastrum complanatum]|nr:hypothetical protein O6H91_Y539400 [Diphasiastrum complanatum]